MPLYEYQCESCGKVTEKIQLKFSDPPLDACPACGGKVTKLVSSPAIQFKGSGWYITDYARKSSGGESKSSGGESKSSDSGSEKTDKGEKAKGESSSSSSETKPTTTKTD
jgi:putative FmdB family regulatory protein